MHLAKKNNNNKSFIVIMKEIYIFELDLFPPDILRACWRS